MKWASRARSMSDIFTDNCDILDNETSYILGNKSLVSSVLFRF